MRPLTLTMEAFGPFKDKTTIDFQAFTDAELVLITGVTGSGKTSIFDAISYALFGSLSGQSRGRETIKSHFASDSDLCRVSFTFSIKDKVYTISRMPEQLGPKTGGKGTKKYNATAELRFDDESIEKIKQVDAMIVSVLGMDVNQFKQIVMLPQGEFKQLLESDSKDKQAIFQQIFHTEIFQVFEKRVQEDVKRTEADYQQVIVEIKASLDQIQIDEDKAPLFELTEKLDLKQLLQELEVLEEVASTDIQALEHELAKLRIKSQQVTSYLTLKSEAAKLQTQAQQLADQKPSYEANKHAVGIGHQAQTISQKVQVHQERLKELALLESKQLATNRQLDESKSQLFMAEQQFQLAEKAYLSLNEAESTLDKLKQEQQNWRQLTQSQLSIDQLFQADKQAKVQQTAAEGQVHLLEKKISATKEKLETLKNKQQDLPKLLEAQFLAKENVAEAKNLFKQIEELRASETSLNNLRQEVEPLFHASKQSREALLELQESFDSQIALILRQDLVDNQACPVCGSFDHPYKATLELATDAKLPTQEEIKMARQQADRDQEVYIEQSQKMKELSELIQKQITDLNLSSGNLDEQQALATIRVMQREAELLQLKNEVQMQQNVVQTIAELQKSLATLESEMKTAEIELAAYRESAARFKGELETLNKQLLTYKEQTTYPDFDKLQADLDQQTERIAVIKLDYHQATEAVRTCNLEVTKLTTQLKAYSEQAEAASLIVDAANLDVDQAIGNSTVGTEWETFLLTVDEIEAKQKFIVDYERQEYELKGSQRQIQNQLAHYREFESEAASIDWESEDMQLKQTISNQQGLVNQGLVKQKLLITAIQKIGHQESKYQSITKTYSQLKEIQDVVYGSKETDYVSFERYVLGIYFDKILQAANGRFTKMTNSRYQMVRQDGGGFGRKASGLDINVYDEYTGQERSVKSLSGGESFKASLALALGLSDVMQEASGGIQVETLFIDEGFGSLDGESLDQAIQVLIELNNSAPRFIGIISHVSELKERINKQILVTSQKEGSHIQLVTE